MTHSQLPPRPQQHPDACDIHHPTPLDPYWARRLADDDDSPADVAHLRAELDALTRDLPRHHVADIRDVTVVHPERDIHCRLYQPAPDASYPVIALYAHGGGWVAGNLDTHDPICRHLVHHSNTTLIAVDYPLAPEHPFPAGLDALDAVFAWLLTHRHELGHDSATPIVAVGDSAGANLAVALTIRAITRGTARPDALALTHPILTTSLDSPSHRAFGTGYGLTTRRLQHLWDLYLTNERIRNEPTAAPINSRLDPDIFRHFPPTYIQTAEYDPARSDADTLAALLAATNGNVTTTCYQGQVHGLQLAFPDNPTAHQSLLDLSTYLRTTRQRTETRLASAEAASGEHTHIVP